MDIQRKAFEQLEDIAAMMTENTGIEFENGKYVYYGLDSRTAFAAVYISGAWSAWQAKAQAVPDGCKVVPVNYECVWCGCTELDGWTDETMIKSQEPK